MIYWDVDGVLRNLTGLVWGEDPEHWDTLSPSNEDIFDILKKHPEYYLDAKAFKNVQVAKDYEAHHGSITFLTHQKSEKAQKYTSLWLASHFKNFNINFVDSMLDKESYLEHGFLIDDCPLFKDYSKIILVHHRYNKHIQAPMRVFTWRDLETCLLKLGEL